MVNAACVSVAVVSAGTVYLGWRHARMLERRIRELEVTAQQQATALEWLTRRTDCLSPPATSQSFSQSEALARAAAVAPGSTGAGTQAAARRSSRDPPVLTRGNSWESMSETAGYKTAEEDTEEGEVAAARPRPGPPLETVPASPAVPSTWGLESTWSCVSSGGAIDGASPLPAESTRQAANSGEGRAIAAESLAAEGAEGWAAVGDEARDPRREGLENVLQRADNLYKERSFADAYALLASAPRTAPTLWRQARLCKELADLAKETGAKEREKELLREGFDLAEAALGLDESNYACHKWYAIFVSVVSMFEGTKAAIQKSFVVKEHFEKAAQLNPSDATSHYLLGMWYFEVAGLSWATRKVAAAIFASPPTGTFEEALSHFDNAERTSPGFYVSNRLMLAKTHLQLKNREMAKSWLQKALELKRESPDDHRAAAEAEKLLASL